MDKKLVLSKLKTMLSEKDYLDIEKTINTTKKIDRQKGDLYPTPPWCYENLPIDWSQFPMIWEPAEGDGRIREYLYSCVGKTSVLLGGDIAKGEDFLKTKRYVDLIITNPPFSLAFEFMQHAVELAPTVILLLRLGIQGSNKRSKWLSENKCTSKYYLSDRPQFMAELDPPVKGTDSSEYAWFVWDKTGKLPKGDFYISKHISVEGAVAKTLIGFNKVLGGK